MKQYLEPAIQIIALDQLDAIRTSLGTDKDPAKGNIFDDVNEF